MTKRNGIIKSLFFALVFPLCCAVLNAEVRIMNPVSGVWANRQALVIETTESEEVFYSFSGADPATSGFAYDGPVVLDVTGNVELRILVVSNENERTEFSVNYSVFPFQGEFLDDGKAAKEGFIAAMEQQPIYEYFSGEVISIPESFEYSIGDSPVLQQGRAVSVSEKSIVDRYVPVCFSDAGYKWRYIVHMQPCLSGELSRRDVPFKIIDWNKIVFTDHRSIYSIDGGWWQGASVPVELDRHMPHTVSWQSAEYSRDNQISTVTLYPAPELISKTLPDGTVSFELLGNQNYRLSGSGEHSDLYIGNGLYKEILLDVFSGDRIKGNIAFDVYCDGIYQGKLFSSYEMNRRSPAPPQIVSSLQTEYSRKAVSIRFDTDADVSLYYSVSEPVEIEIPHNGAFSDLPDIKKLEYHSPEMKLLQIPCITIDNESERIYAYKVTACAVDRWGNRSKDASSCFIVDKVNYFVDSASDAGNPDGSPYFPYKDLSCIREISGQSRFSRIYVNGAVMLPAGEISFSSDMEFCGSEYSRIQLPYETVISLRNGSLSAKKIIFEKLNAADSSRRISDRPKNNMIIMEHSSAAFEDCEIIGNFEADGMLFNMNSSSASFRNCGLSAVAQGYSSVISGIDSKISMKKTRAMCFASIGVVFSLKNGTFSLEESDCSISARMPRIAEFMSNLILLKDNTFNVDLSKASRNRMSYSDLLWKDMNVKIIEESGNKYNGGLN